MELLTQNYQNILLVLGAVYPALLFLLPASVATKIGLGIKIIKTVVDTLEKAQNTKKGLTFEKDSINKPFIQKSRF